MRRPLQTSSDRARQSVLLLQGPSSPFFALLGHSLRQRGAEVCRVIFCPGDALYWRASCGSAVAFRGRAAEWPAFLLDLVKSRNISDLVCLGDTRWQHRAAIEALSDRPVKIHVVEHGYLRPGWLTVQQGGIGPNSPLPTDRKGVFAMAAGFGTPVSRKFRASFFEYAALDIGYHFANLTTGWALFPRYRRHALDHPIKEWVGWFGRILRTVSTRRQIGKTMKMIGDSPIYLVPLQLETDFQIRLHGPKGGQRPQIARLIESFANHASADQHLVFKMHPLDNGWSPWEVTINDAANKAGVSARCHFVEGGDLGTLLDKASGVLTVNSTVGLEAITQGLPVRVSGEALYKVEGLVHSGSLEAFWKNPEPPDPELAEAFVRMLKNRAMLPGAFDGSGARVGATAIADRICGSADVEAA